MGLHGCNRHVVTAWITGPHAWALFRVDGFWSYPKSTAPELKLQQRWQSTYAHTGFHRTLRRSVSSLRQAHVDKPSTPLTHSSRAFTRNRERRLCPDLQHFVSFWLASLMRPVVTRGGTCPSTCVLVTIFVTCTEQQVGTQLSEWHVPSNISALPLSKEASIAIGPAHSEGHEQVVLRSSQCCWGFSWSALVLGEHCITL